MVLLVFIAIMIFLAHNYNKHYIETKDTSIEGFIEYMKEKYYKKKD